ncbi:MAG: hypothetical protein JWN22_621 [Nocardioides sp.]|jgi:hypothetical protein|nr:hypothetical protein [Nocardioides sp.]
MADCPLSPDEFRASLAALTAKGVRRTEACFPAFGEANATFQQALTDEGVAEGDVIDTLEAVSRALASATARLAGQD